MVFDLLRIKKRERTNAVIIEKGGKSIFHISKGKISMLKNKS